MGKRIWKRNYFSKILSVFFVFFARTNYSIIYVSVIFDIHFTLNG